MDCLVSEGGVLVGSYLILQGGEFLKNVAELVSLTSPIMPMDLSKTTEWLQCGEIC